MDMPKNATEFIAAFERQQAIARTTRPSLHISPEMMTDHRRYISNVCPPVDWPGKQTMRRAAPMVAEMVRSENVPYNFTTMSVGDVGVMLKSIGLGDHCAAFEKKAVDGVLLAMLDEPTLAELGVESRLDRKMILAWGV